MTALPIVLLSVVFSLIVSADPERPAKPEERPSSGQKTQPAIEKLDATHFRIGEVTFDRLTREVRIPAEVNMTEGLLEFLLVHKDGKVHESLLKTNIKASHLNLAFTLLRYKPSRELYVVYDPKSGQNTGKFAEVPDAVKIAAKMNIKVEWNDNGQIKTCPVNEWITDTSTDKEMPAGPWVYGGSETENGRFVPELTGDILTIFLTNSALVLYPGHDNQNDCVWLPFPKRVPPLETPVTLIFSPNTPTPPASKP
jgi:hypothetical protein